MPRRTSKTGSELFIVDNSDDDWKVQRYLHDWCGLSKAIDIATGWSLWIGVGLIALGVVVSVLASFEYFRFVQLSKQGRSYLPRTALLAVIVAAILGFLGIVMAVYLVLIGT